MTHDEELDKIRDKMKQLTKEHPRFQFLSIVATIDETIDDPSVLLTGNACGVCVTHYLLGMVMRNELQHLSHNEPQLEDMDVSDTKQ